MVLYFNRVDQPENHYLFPYNMIAKHINQLALFFIIIMRGLLLFVFCKSSSTMAAEEYGVVF